VSNWRNKAFIQKQMTHQGCLRPVAKYYQISLTLNNDWKRIHSESFNSRDKDCRGGILWAMLSCGSSTGSLLFLAWHTTMFWLEYWMDLSFVLLTDKSGTVVADDCPTWRSSWTTMPWVLWVVPTPLGVSSLMSKLSHTKWQTLFELIEMFDGRTVSQRITCFAKAVSSSKTVDYEEQYPNRLTKVTLSSRPVMRSRL